MDNDLSTVRESHGQGRWILRPRHEPGLPEAEAVESADNGGRGAASSLTRSLLAFAFILLILGVLPASVVLWGCLMTLIFSLCRVRLHAHQLAVADQEDLVPAVSPSGRLRPRSPGPVIRILPGGAGFLMLSADPHTALQRINAQLRQLDEEMGAADYETLLRLGLHPSAMPAPRAPPVTDQDIATLPCHPYKPPRSAQQPHQSPPSSLPPQSAQQQLVANSKAGPGPQAPAPQPAALPSIASCCAGAGGLHAERAASAEGGSCPSSSGRHAGTCCGGGEGSKGGGADASELTCSVCLDAVEEGAIVMTLPCLHQFHASCITPWLRQQGLHAPCPMCKTPVFR